MKKEVMLLVVILLLLPVAYAETTVLHEGWYKYRDTFQIGEDVYRTRLLETNLNQLRLDVNNFTVLIQIGSCAEYESYEFCYEEYSYEVNEVDISDTGQLVPGVKLKIQEYSITEEQQSFASNVNININYPTNLQVGQVYEITIDMQNSGNTEAGSIYYEIYFPSNLEITYMGGGMLRAGNKFMISTALIEEQQKSFSFKFKTSSLETLNFTYNYLIRGANENKSDSGSFQITLPDPYAYSTWFTAESVEVLQTSELGIYLRNDDPYESLKIKNITIQASPTLYFEPTMTLYRSKYGEYKGNVYELGPGEETEFKIKIKPLYTGTYTIRAEVLFEIQNKTFYDNITKTLSASLGGMQADLSLESYDVVSGSDVFLYYSITNTNPNFVFRNLDIKIDGGFFQEEKTIEAINRGEKIDLLIKQIKTPIVEADKEYNITARLFYKDAADVISTLINLVTLKVTGTGSLLSLRQEINKETVEIGEEIIVEVFVGNLKDNSFNAISVEDTTSQPVQLVVGETSASVNLKGKEEKKSYLYKILIPENYTQNTLEITSTAKMNQYGYEVKQSKTINVIAPPPQEENAQQQENQDQQENNYEEEKKESTWTKIIRGIGDFFTRLFSRN